VRARRSLVALALVALLAATSFGQRTVEAADPSVGAQGPTALGASPMRIAFDEAVAAQAERAGAEAEATDESPEAALGGPRGQLSTAVEVALLLTLLSLLPAALITLTCFTRIVIVLSFVRRALSVNELPPNPVIIGLALFLTMFVMAPVAEELYEETWTPYQAGELTITEAGDNAWQTLGAFLLANTRKAELALFDELAHGSEDDGAMASGDDVVDVVDAAPTNELPALRVLVPAFILSELKTAFQMGFLLFLPFLVIDLVVSSVLLSMGMMMLPPVMISTPIKVLIFVLVDGWRLVCESLVTSFTVMTS
jgi:flagellar biosynthetic protein FliP